MPRAKRPAPCHPDRDHYAKELCKSCYDAIHRSKASRQKVDAAYEERNRKERNRDRAERAKAKYQAKRDKPSEPENS